MLKIKANIFTGIAFSLAIGMAPAQAADSEHNDKSISTLYTHATSTCVFFQLNGVTEANPGIANSPWFAIEKTNKESYAQLLSARVAEKPLKRVYSDGTVLCGVAKVMVIEL